MNSCSDALAKKLPAGYDGTQEAGTPDPYYHYNIKFEGSAIPVACGLVTGDCNFDVN